MIKKRVISEDYREEVRHLLDQAGRTGNFGNARGVRNVVDRIVCRMDSRIGSLLENGVKVSKEDFIFN